MLGKIPAARLALIEKIVAQRHPPGSRHASRPDARVRARILPRRVRRRSAPASRRPRWRPRRWRHLSLRCATRAQPGAGRPRAAARHGLRHRGAPRAGARGRAGHALPGRLDQHRVQPDEHRGASHRAPGARRAPRRAWPAAQHWRRRRRAVGILADGGNRPPADEPRGARTAAPAACRARRRAQGGGGLSGHAGSRARRGQRTRARRGCRCRGRTPPRRAPCSRGCTTGTSCSSATATTACAARVRATCWCATRTAASASCATSRIARRPRPSCSPAKCAARRASRTCWC